jgi:hypothetical protein
MIELLGRLKQRLHLVDFQERPSRPNRLQPPTTTAGGVRAEDLVVDRNVEHRAQQPERLVDGLIAERTDTTEVGFTRKSS